MDSGWSRSRVRSPVRRELISDVIVVSKEDSRFGVESTGCEQLGFIDGFGEVSHATPSLLGCRIVLRCTSTFILRMCGLGRVAKVE